MQRGGLSRVAAIVVCLATVGLAASTLPARQASRQFVIVLKGQGADLTGLVAGAGGMIIARLDPIGVVLAESSNPDFLVAVSADTRVQEAAEDVEVRWITDPPAARAIDLAPGEAGINTEPFFGFQWNLPIIGADQAAAAGFLGWGVKRARVAVLDSGIYTTHLDIAPNLNLGLSASFTR